MGTRMVKDIEKHDIQLASKCTTKGYYGMLSGSSNTYFLVKSDRKWSWVSPGSDKNYCNGCNTFKEAMDKAVEFDENLVLFFDDKISLYVFMSSPDDYL